MTIGSKTCHKPRTHGTEILLIGICGVMPHPGCPYGRYSFHSAFILASVADLTFPFSTVSIPRKFISSDHCADPTVSFCFVFDV